MIAASGFSDDEVLRLAASLAQGSEPIDAAEARLAHVVRMIGEMNRIAGGLEPEEARDPVNKDAAVKAEHAALRSASTSA